MKRDLERALLSGKFFGVLLLGSLFPSFVLGEDPNSYRGFVLGKASQEEVKKQLGDSPIKTPWGDDLRYPLADRPKLNDRLYFSRGKLELVTAATVDSRYSSLEKITSTLGKPEMHVRFQTQQYLDYSEHGLRFICNASGKTTGVIHFVPIRRRVPAGHPATRIDLSRPVPSSVPRAMSPPKDFKVGAAQLDINPPTFENLSDPSNPKYHLAENLFVRAAAFQRGDTKLVLVGADVFAIAPWDLEALLARLAKKGFPDVIVAMSHTHANVDTVGFYGYYPKEYAKFVMQRIEECVEKAAAAARPIKCLNIGTMEMPLDGGRVVDLIRNGRDPGVMNPEVSVIQAIGIDDKPIVHVIHLTCHPEVVRLEKTMGLSPDFVGTLCKEVAQELGGQSVFLNGALGGMITPDARDNTQEEGERVGRELAKFVIQAVQAALPSQSYTLFRKRRPVEYPITGESVLAFLKNPPEPIDFFQERVRTEMNALWIGDAQFITVPGELLPDIGFEIEARMTGRVRGIIGLVNGELGYLIPSYDFRAGDYEERTGPGSAGGEITRSVGFELAPWRPMEK